MSDLTKPLSIGLFGFGAVGQGLYDVLQRTPSLRTRITRICVRDPLKSRSLPAELFTYDREDILADPNVDVVVELIDDAEAAFSIISRALRNGKPVVSANKRMIANKMPELLALQRETGVPFLYEASVAGSIPILRNLEEYYDNDLLEGLDGIVNGTTNYILTALTRGTALNETAYADALKDAQRKGFAESDPTMDVEGWDAAFKTVLLALHGFGKVLRPEQVIRRGISTVRAEDIVFARTRKAVIKLIARVRYAEGELIASVLPTLLSADDALARVDRELNAVRLRAAFADQQWLVGKGAGGSPTASAVLSDLSALRYGYRYAYRKLLANGSTRIAQNWFVTLLAAGPAKEVAGIPFSNVISEERSGSFTRVIGTVDLARLSTLPVFRSRTLFLAEVAEGVVAEEVDGVVNERELADHSIH